MNRQPEHVNERQLELGRIMARRYAPSREILVRIIVDNHRVVDRRLAIALPPFGPYQIFERVGSLIDIPVQVARAAEPTRRRRWWQRREPEPPGVPGAVVRIPFDVDLELELRELPR